MPPDHMLNKDFLKQVLTEEKQLLKKQDVQHIIPDAFSPGKGPSREYFYNVLNTVHPDFLKRLLDHANKQRMTVEGEAGQTEGIQISEFWEQ